MYQKSFNYTYISLIISFYTYTYDASTRLVPYVHYILVSRILILVTHNLLTYRLSCPFATAKF